MKESRIKILGKFLGLLIILIIITSTSLLLGLIVLGGIEVWKAVLSL